MWWSKESLPPNTSMMNCPIRARNAIKGVKRVLEHFVSGQRCLSYHARPQSPSALLTNGPSSRFFATGTSSSNKQTNNAKYKDLQKNRNDTTGSLLNTHMDRAGAKQANAGRPGSDGVFYLGIRPGQYDTPKNYKQWKELGVAGKVARTGARTSSLVVILFGGGLTLLLAYALISELGSKNSPTVIYSDACELIQNHEGLRRVLPPSSHIKFHTSSPRPSSDRPRHRNRSVPSAVIVDSAGNEHLYLSFWIEAVPDSLDSLTYRNLEWWDVREWDWSIANAKRWAISTRHEVWMRTRRAFALLTGQPLGTSEQTSSSPVTPHHPATSTAATTALSQKSGTSQQKSGLQSNPDPAPQSQSIWTTLGLTGLFTALRPTSAALSRAQAGNKERMVFTSGEVHVDLIRDSSNNLTYRYILVDLPNSTGAGSRVFIKRTAGVTEHESVMRFS